MKYSVVLITTSSQEEAERIANGLIDAEVAACVNIVPKIKSIFKWQGKKEEADESLLIVKTQQDRFRNLKETVKGLHSYDVPEIISISISDGNEDYLSWISEVLTTPHA